MDLSKILSAGLEFAAQSAIRVPVFNQAGVWMDTSFSDISELDDAIRQYVFSRSVDELRLMDDVLKMQAKTSTWDDRKFDKSMLIFACFHGALTLRNLYLQSR